MVIPQKLHEAFKDKTNQELSPSPTNQEVSF